jgi:hypothetical protein
VNVFVLCTGRCGSVTLSKACKHIKNYSTGHESRVSCLGDERVKYPNNHIEIDNRLTWFLPRLDSKFGDNAIYIHLKRDEEKVARSFLKILQKKAGIIDAYANSILLHSSVSLNEDSSNLDNNLAICKDYIRTVNESITAFLRNKTKKMRFNLEDYEVDFTEFWEMIDAQGDINIAIKEFSIMYNASIK